MVKKLELPIIERKKIAEDTFEIRFGLENKRFNFKAGQYVKISIKVNVKDNRGSSKDFSISSSPNTKDYIATCLRIPDKASEFKQFITSCPIGTKVRIVGPQGVFTLPEKTDRHIVMLAGGIGITPFMSMIRFSGEEGLEYKLHLVYTNKNKKRLAYLKELKILEKKNPNFNMETLFERINQEFIAEKVKKSQNALWYICGLPAMVVNVREILMKTSVAEKDIFLEEFTGY